MPETETAPAPHHHHPVAPPHSTAAAAMESGNPQQNVRYQISEDAMKSLRISRHINKSNSALVIPVRRPSRNHSGGSRRSRDQSPTNNSTPTAQQQQQVPTTPDNNNNNPNNNNNTTTRYSNRSSTTSSSLWSSIRGGPGRRIYGSAVSVASSITLTEFSEDFGVSDRSLDLRQFAIDEDEYEYDHQEYYNNTNNNTNSSNMMDSSPMLPKRQTSQRDGSSRNNNNNNNNNQSSFTSLSTSGRTFGTDTTTSDNDSAAAGGGGKSDSSNPKQENNNNNIDRTKNGHNNNNNKKIKCGFRGREEDDDRGTDRIPAPPPRVEYQLSSISDLSPRQPGRKTSLANNSTTTTTAAAIAAASIAGTASLSATSTIPANNLHHHHHNNNNNNNSQNPPQQHKRSNTMDSCPQYPCRKKSSIVIKDEEELEQVQQFLLDLNEMGKLFQDNIPLATLTYHDGKEYENAFSGSKAIDHMIDIGLVSDRQEGLELGLELEKELGLFHHVVVVVVDVVPQEQEQEQPKQQQQQQQQQPPVGEGEELEEEEEAQTLLLLRFCDDPNEIYQFAPPPDIPERQRLFSVLSKTDTTITSIREE